MQVLAYDVGFEFGHTMGQLPLQVCFANESHLSFLR